MKKTKKLDRKQLKGVPHLLGSGHTSQPQCSLQGSKAETLSVTHQLANSDTETPKKFFSFSDRLFRDGSGSTRTVSHGYKRFMDGPMVEENCRNLVTFLKSFFPFPADLLRGLTARVFILSSITLGACSHVQPQTHSIEAEFQEIEQIAIDGETDVLQLPISDNTIQIGGKDNKPLRTKLSKKTRTTRLDGPIRFAFTAVPADMILRRISEYTDLQFIADEELIANSLVTLDLTATTPEDIYNLVDIIGTMLGVKVQWLGKKAVITGALGPSVRPIDGYLISPIKLTASTAEIVAARYGAQCSEVSGMTLCLGENAALEQTNNFIRAVESARDLVSYRLVKSDADLSLIVDTLSLRDRVVTNRLQDGQWLLVSNDPRHFETILEITEAVDFSQCETAIFQPLHLDAQEFLPLFDQESECPPPSIVGRKLIYSGLSFQNSHKQALMVRLDRPKPLARLFVLIGNQSSSTALGANLEGFEGRLPQSGIFDAITLAASLSKSSGWRTLEVVTDGESDSNVTQTDRVDGNVVVTDGGSQVQGIENRTVGLSLQITGVVTPTGYRGRIAFSDSSLDGDITRTSSCASYVALDLHQLTKVCTYDRSDRSDTASLFKVDRSKIADKLQVFVGLVAHEVASLETLRKVLS